MLAVLQIPLVDGRSFLAADTTRLTRPVWDAPAGVPDFLRGMGGMSVRWLRGTPQWHNEDIYCSARRWLRFNPKVPWVLGANGKNVGGAVPVFRRWMSDGRLVFRLEVGARIWIAPAGRTLNENEAAEALTSWLSHPVETHGLGDNRKLTLAQLPAAAFEGYCRASSAHGSDLKPPRQWLLRSAPVMVYVDAWKDELPVLPPHAEPVTLPAELSAFGDAHLWQVAHQGVTYRFCLVRKHGTFTRPLQEAFRDLRLNLLRLHAENIGLSEVRRWTQTMPERYRQLDPARLIPYLENALVHLRPDRGPKADPPSFRASRAILEALSPGRSGILLDELQKFVEHPSHKLVSIVQSLHDPHSAQRTRVTMDPKTGKIQLDQATVVRSPWASGSFYLFCVIAFILTLRIAFGQLHPIWLPVVLVGGVIVSVVVGALQLKQDARLSERGFLSLISVAFRSLPLVRSLVPSTAKRRKSSDE
jgi:hypothetical protein